MSPLLVVLLVVAGAAFLWTRRPKRPEGFPPGPPTFLVFGNIGDIIQQASGKFRENIEYLRNKYNRSIIGLIDPFGERVVHIFDIDLIKETCSKPEFSGRPTQFPILYRSYMKKLGLMFSEGDMWQEHRRFSLKHLKDLGFGKNSLVDVITDEYDHMAKDLMKNTGKAISLSGYFNMMALNVIWKLVANERYDLDDPKARHLIGLVNDLFITFGPENLLNYIPWIRHIIPEKSGFSVLHNHREQTTEMFRRVVQEHRRNLDPDNPKDFIDVFLIEMEKPGAAERGFNVENLSIIGMDFFGAGSETTATSLRWAILLMVLYPEVQQKVQQELDEVVGRERYPRYEDRSHLPFTEAVLNEIWRFGGVVSQVVPHYTSFGPAQLAGYTIPKDTLILMHLETLNKDKEHWGDPENFRPERFLSADGKLKTDSYFIPFGVGKRSCLGESLARMEFFVFFTCFFQQFSFRLPEGYPRPCTQTKYAVFLRPDDYLVVPEVRG